MNIHAFVSYLQKNRENLRFIQKLPPFFDTFYAKTKNRVFHRFFVENSVICVENSPNARKSRVLNVENPVESVEKYGCSLRCHFVQSRLALYSCRTRAITLYKSIFRAQDSPPYWILYQDPPLGKARAGALDSGYPTPILQTETPRIHEHREFSIFPPG